MTLAHGKPKIICPKCGRCIVIGRLSDLQYVVCCQNQSLLFPHLVQTEGWNWVLQTKSSSREQLDEHPSPSTVLPSSHCSELSGWVTLSPHVHAAVSIWQVELHPLQLKVSPSSHCSPLSGSRSSFPHLHSTVSFRQLASHPSLFLVFPSSHSSAPSRAPFPH